MLEKYNLKNCGDYELLEMPFYKLKFKKDGRDKKYYEITLVDSNDDYIDKFWVEEDIVEKYLEKNTDDLNKAIGHIKTQMESTIDKLSKYKVSDAVKVPYPAIYGYSIEYNGTMDTV